MHGGHGDLRCPFKKWLKILQAAAPDILHSQSDLKCKLHIWLESSIRFALFEDLLMAQCFTLSAAP